MYGAAWYSGVSWRSYGVDICLRPDGGFHNALVYPPRELMQGNDEKWPTITFFM